MRERNPIETPVKETRADGVSPSALLAADRRQREIIDALIEGVVVFDRSGANVLTNPSAARMLGVSIDEATGHYIGDPRWKTVRPDGSPFPGGNHPAAVTRLTGEPASGVVMGMVAPDDTLTWLSINTRALDAGSHEPPYDVVASFSDISALMRAEHDALARADELQRIGARDVAAVEALFQQSQVAMVLFDAEGRFMRVNDTFARVNRMPAEAHIGRTMTELFGDAGEPLERLVRTVLTSGEPEVDVEISAELDGRTSHQVVTCSPMRGTAGQLLGASATVIDVTERVRAEAERKFLHARERAASARTARLQRVTAALSGALSAGDVARVLAEEASGALGAERGWVSLIGRDRETLELAAAAGFVSEAAKAFSRVPLAARTPGADAVRDGRPRYFGSAAEQAREYPDLAEAYRAAGNEAGAIVPITGRRGTAGYVAIADSRPHEYTSADRALLETIARQCAEALDRAEAYEREHRTAATLIQSLLPERLPEIPGVALAARYEPAPAARVAVGGDFYDAFPVGPESWLLIVGDVCGKGPDAAALTSLVRYTLRAVASRETDPGRLLLLVNEAILAQRSDQRFCTAVCVRLDLRGPSGGAAATVSAAGHPPPLVMRADGSAAALEPGGMVLGIAPDPSIGEQRVDLAPGDGLFLYTDGLLEAHAPDRLLLPADLATLLAAGHPNGLDELVETLRRGAVDELEGAPRDDIAILAARLDVF